MVNTLKLDALVAGGLAGSSVDIALFPLDTIKTRMQSAQGFFGAGGFRGVYAGLGTAALGSFPNAALFFVTYESLKPVLQSKLPEGMDAAAHMLAGSAGEAMACLIRVPTENIKQKLQAGLYKETTAAVQGVIRKQGFSGFYTGYGTTLMREVPFSAIQFPIWEKLKKIIHVTTGRPARSWESAACGSASGAFSAALTTPLDVVKTRLMLGYDRQGVQYKGMVPTMTRIYREEGARALFSGIVPRVMWIGIGGFVFFGCYESMKSLLTPILGDDESEATLDEAIQNLDN